MKKILMLLAMVLLVVGCSSKDSQASQDKPLAGTSLNLYTWDGMFPQEVLDGFEKETGITINYSNFDYDEVMLSKLEETQGKEYDLVLADDYIIELAIQEGLVQKLDKSKIENISNINPLFTGLFYDPTDEYTIPYGAGIPLIVYNPELTDLEITSYKDLWDASLVNNVGITSNFRVINGITLKSLGYSFNTENVDEINQAKDRLMELAPNIRVINDNNLQDYLLSGEVAAAFMYTSQVNQALMANENLVSVYPSEGLGFGVMAAFIPSQAPNAEAAHMFLNYINQPENAAKCFEYLGYYSTNKAADDLISDEMKKLIVYPEDKADILEKGELIENISEEALELHNRIWEEFRQKTN